MSDPRITAVKHVLLRLLHDEDTRRRFVQHGPSALGTDDDTARALGTIDCKQLESTAARIAGDLLTRKHRGSDGLEESFRETLAGVDVREALLSRFVASRFYAAYRELEGARGKGLCIEEAFYRFLDDEDVGERTTRRREYLDALFRALCLQPRPLFRVPDEVVRLPAGGYRHVERTPAGPFLYAVVGGRLVRGPLTELLARVLEHEGVRSPDDTVPPHAWSACVEKLTTLGLLGDHMGDRVGA